MKSVSLKTVEKYRKLIKSRKFTEKDLIYFRKCVNGSSRLDVYTAMDLVYEFNRVAETKGIQLTAEQQLKGIEWLRRKTFKLNGHVRKTPPVGTAEQAIIRKFKRFTCVGLYDLSENNYRHYVPVYRCFDTKGNYFDYVCKMWGEIIVINVCVYRPQLRLVA